MQQCQKTIEVATNGQGLYEITTVIDRWLKKQKTNIGLLTVFCRHTSASLTIQENADPDVLKDLDEFFKRLVPENIPWVRHVMEGPDDMPAHIKSALTDTSVSIPVSQGQMALGTWQGIYLFEHRTHPHTRQIILHFLGD